MLLSIASILTALQAGQSIDEAFTTIPNPSTIDYTAFQQAGMYDGTASFPLATMTPAQTPQTPTQVGPLWRHVPKQGRLLSAVTSFQSKQAIASLVSLTVLLDTTQDDAM